MEVKKEMSYMGKIILFPVFCKRHFPVYHVIINSETSGKTAKVDELKR